MPQRPKSLPTAAAMLHLASLIWAFVCIRSTVAAANPPRRPTDCLDTTTAGEINRLFRVGGAGKQVALCPLALVIVSADAGRARKRKLTLNAHAGRPA